MSSVRSQNKNTTFLTIISQMIFVAEMWLQFLGACN